MPVGCDMKCDACGHEQSFCSDVMSLQLDDGSLAHLPHPGEGRHCERFGLTLEQAAERRRLFRKRFNACRRCGDTTYRVQAVLPWPPDPYRIVDLGPPWFLVKLSAVVAIVGGPLALVLGWRQMALALAITPPVALIIVLGEAWQQRAENRHEPKPQLPTADAPGRTPILPPEPPPACCASPDLVDALRVDDEHRIPCRACGRGTLRVTSRWIA